MVYVKLVNMEDKPCGISHEFVFRRNLNVHFVALLIRSVETPSASNYFLLWTIPCRLGGTLRKCSRTLLNFVNSAAQYSCITTQSTSTVSKECFQLTSHPPYWCS